jgi:hypothetical protein
MARPGLRQHPKFRRLVHLLAEPEPHVLGYLECLWLAGYERGDEVLGDELDVELAAEYPGKRGRLFAALLDARLIDRLDDGRYAIHDLYVNAPEYVRKRLDREAARRAAGMTMAQVRAAAARKRWERARQPDAAGVQAAASDMQTAATCSRSAANGCDRVQDGTTPGPAHLGEESPKHALRPRGHVCGLRPVPGKEVGLEDQDAPAPEPERSRDR